MTDPTAVAFFDKGYAYQEAKFTEVAMQMYSNCLKLDNTISAAWYNMASLYYLQKKYKQSSACMQRAIQLEPDNTKALCNFSDLLWMQEEYETSRLVLQHVLSLEPDNPNAQFNLGMCLKNEGKFVEAQESINKALEKEPDNTIYNRGLIHAVLASADYQRGFELYHKFPHVMNSATLRTETPHWQGENLSGKKLHIWSHDGIGDQIMFSRFLRWITDDCSVTLDVHPELVGLFQTNFPEITVRGKGNQLNPAPPEADYFCYMSSLPHLVVRQFEQMTYVCGCTGSSTSYSYLKCWDLGGGSHVVLGDGPAKKIGILWEGHTSLGCFQPAATVTDIVEALLAVPNVELYSLQVGPAAAELAQEGLNPVVTDLSPLLTDMSVTASILDQLDAVVTLDTSIAHLAGAMGVKTFVMLRSHSPDWRWQWDRSDSPWYESITLFRKQRFEGWRRVLGEIANAVGAL